MTARDDLAHRAGIEPSFQDARQQTVTASPAVKTRLLEAMGLAAADDVQAQATLDRLDRLDWGRALPPVHVTGEGGVTTIDVTCAPDTREVAWQLTREGGAAQSGVASFPDLDVLARRTLDGTPLERRRLVLGSDLPIGYHRLVVGAAECMLIVVPARCWLPPAALAGQRLWGITTQLYLMRSRANWGIGDYTDLRRLVDLLAPRGAAVIGLNPLHALFPDNPEQASPYSPASRLLLNVLNIDVTAVPGYADCAPAQAIVASRAWQATLAACRAAKLVAYRDVTRLKLTILEKLFTELPIAEQAALREFREAQGADFERTCRYEALREKFAAADPAHAAWQDWPAAYQDADGDAVAGFAQDHAPRVAFHAWLQFSADRQLAAAAAAARDGGMTIGLYRDLAVGADRGGAETWCNRRAVVADAAIGAPPDIYLPAGQNWGLPPFHPQALREEAYRSFIALVRANMRHAGGLRIDHVMALQHLYWVPQGSTPAEGAYVRYPLDDLVGILALESQRHRCIVVGEDLGTVPDGFRERMAAANILSYRVLFFEQDARGAYVPPAAYPALSLSVIGSHDMPTLRGWWDGSDILLKENLGLYPAAGEAGRQQARRDQDRAALLAALAEAGLIEAGTPIDATILVRAAHAFLACTPSVLAMAQIDDITDEPDPVNVPSTSDEHPNWRRRLSCDLEDLETGSRLDAICRLLADARTKRISPHGTDA